MGTLRNAQKLVSYIHQTNQQSCASVIVMTTTVGEEFDGISEIYDSTRRAATEAELKAVSSELGGCHTILDVGVGTGRFAKPLYDLGFEIVGIDLSRKMMSKARQKGVHNLVLADAHSMPFKEESFDASMIVHVLHLVPDWLKVVREMGRVTKHRVAALLRNRQREWNNTAHVSGNAPAPQVFPDLWTQYAQLREEMGYPIRRSRRMWQNEEEIRSKLPPMKLVKVSDEVVVTSISDLMTRFQQRSYPMQQDIPADVHNKIVQKLLSPIVKARQDSEKRTSLQEEKIERRVVEELAIWRPDQLR
jgi:ubiquinone/menaquinone biosynthesis C-methylase UbiE